MCDKTVLLIHKHVTAELTTDMHWQHQQISGVHSTLDTSTDTISDLGQSVIIHVIDERSKQIHVRICAKWRHFEHLIRINIMHMLTLGLFILQTLQSNHPELC